MSSDEIKSVVRPELISEVSPDINVDSVPVHIRRAGLGACQLSCSSCCPRYQARSRAMSELQYKVSHSLSSEDFQLTSRCRLHVPIPSIAHNAPASSTSSRAPSPGSASHTSAEGRSGGHSAGPEKGTGGSTGVGSGGGKMDGNGNAFFDCLVCHRSVCPPRPN
jgi:hypothetical protein